MPKIISIIVTYNGKDWIKKCLDSLINSTVKTEIAVIDNNSSDNTTEIIKQHYQGIQLIQSSKNLGFGQANNIGFKLALEKNADFIFLLNQDASVEKNTIETLINVLNQTNKIGILSPIHLNGDGTMFDYRFYTFIKDNNHLIFDLFRNSVKEIYPIQFVNAAAWLLTKECIKDVGIFDSLFYHYGEDNNYVQRVKYKGYRIGIVPAAVIYHDRNHQTQANKGIDPYKLILIKLADINLNKFKSEFLKLLLHHSFKMIKYLLVLKFRKSNSHARIVINMFRDHNKIISSRKRNK